jgi:predicted Ser/Thr protein kinase
VSAEPPPIDLDALLPSIEATIGDGSKRLNAGYQGAVYLIEHAERRLIVKAATGRGLLRQLRLRHLRHEHRAYTRLGGVTGVPRCHGLAGGRFLVLDYIEGPNARDARLADHDAFYDRALAVIQAIHARGVAHGDLKRRDNLLVGDAERPFLLDFGLAVLRAQGFHPCNHWLFDLACRYDLNAWIKHKYRYREGEISPADSIYRRPLPFEAAWRRTRRFLRAPLRAWRQTRGH